MQYVTNAEELKLRILILKDRQKIEEQELKEQLKRIHESLSPGNPLMSAVKELVNVSGVKGNAVTVIVSMLAGYLSKKIAIGSTHNPIKMVCGSILQAGVASIVTKNSELIKGIGLATLRTIFRKKEARP